MIFSWILAAAAAAHTEVLLAFPEDLGQVPVVVEVKDAEGMGTRNTVTADNPKLSLAGAPPWHVRVLRPSLWPESVSVPASVSSGTKIRFWWKSEVLFSAEGLPSPSVDIKAVLFPRRGSEGPPLELGCECEDRGWRCLAPAGRWRAKLSIPGFVSVRLDELELRGGQTKEVRGIHVRPEAKVTGLLTPPPEKPLPLLLLPVKPAFPMSDPMDDPFYREEAVTDREGAFTFAGLEGGTYELRLNSSCGARLLRFSLASASSLSLPGLRVACGGQLRVHVSPRLQGMWNLLVFAEDPWATLLTPVVQAQVSSGKSWVSASLPEGNYSVVLHNAQGEALSFADVWVGEAGASLDIGMEGFVARGAIYYGDKPWKGRFKFLKAENGPLEVHVTTDEEGRFTTFLPQKGQWLASPLSESFRSDDALLIEALPGRTLTVRFPATRLSGYVFAEGKALGAAFLYVEGKGISASAGGRVQDNGFFQVDGLPEGEYWVQAISDSGISPALTVHLADGQPLTQDIALVPFAFLELELRDGEQPVAGALVHFRPFGEGVPAQLAPSTPVSSDGHGIVRLPVPPAAVAVGGLIFAPPLAVHSFLVHTPFPRSLAITMDQRSGTLVVPKRLVLGGEEKRRSYLLPMVNDYVIDIFQELPAWREIYGTTSDFEETVLFMAPAGHHRLCLVPAHRLWETLTFFPPPNDLACATGKLVPNTVLRLKAPKKNS